MRRELVLAVAVLLAGCVAGPTAQSPTGESARVTAVVDGDTVEVAYPDGTRETVRLLGVDAPETRGETSPAEFEGVPDTPAARDCLRRWGERATAVAERRLAGREVRVVVGGDRRGDYGRLLAYVTVADREESFNHRLLRTGHARVYVSEFDRLSEYRATAERARQRNVGLWACR